MDAVEAVMLQEGYAALSARSIARSADLNYQLIFYYFENLDGLLLATYRRRTTRMLAELAIALDGPHPLHALWQAASNPDGAALSLEYMAMSNHKPAIRAETLLHVKRTEDLVAATMTGCLENGSPGRQPVPAASTSMVVAMLGTNLGFQVAQGIEGRSIQDARQLIEAWIDAMEPL